MEITTLALIVYIIGVIAVVEYIYWCRYIPRLRESARNNYEDL